MSSTNIRKTIDQFYFTDSLIYLIGFLILYFICKKPEKTKFLYAVASIILIVTLFNLDLKFGLKLEGKDCDKILRINPVKLKENCFREIYRYVDDTCFYNNIWRVSLLSALLIGLLILPFIPYDKVKYYPYIIICFGCVIYHPLNWKLTHSYQFIFKSIKHVSKHLEDKSDEIYKPLSHYCHVQKDS